MKKIIYIIICLLALNSCDEFLDVKPTGVVIPESVEHFDQMLTGVNYFFESVVLYMDPDVYTNVISLAYQWSDQAFRSDEKDLAYNKLYENIYIANYVLENIDSAPLDGKESLREYVKGCAYAERAANYYILVNTYGPHYNSTTSSSDIAVPIVLSSDLTQDQTNATVEDLYLQIIEDLDEADKLLNSNEIPYDPTRGSKLGINGLYAKIYLYMGDFAKAKEYADKCLNAYDFLYDFNTTDEEKPVPVHYYKNEENIWARTFRQRQSYFDLNYSADLAGIYDVVNDLRFVRYHKTSVVLPEGVYEYEQNLAYDPTLLVSVPDILLLRAECHAHANKLNLAMADLDALRINRYKIDGYFAYSDAANMPATKDEALALIRIERRRELPFSGLNLFDLKRYHAQGRDVDIFTRTIGDIEYVLTPGSSKYYVGIANSILVLSDNMVSNK